MDKHSLLKTKRRLTIIFTLLVFGLALFLEFSFFSLKYLGFSRIEKENMLILSDTLKRTNIPVNKISIFFSVQRKFLRRDIGKQVEDELESREEGKLVNFIALNKNNEVVAHNINNDINLRVVEAAFQSGKKGVNILSGLITSIMDLPDNYTLILFKNVRYSFSAYIEDVLYFALIILLCSILFYYMGFRFVEKILEPVEDNLRDMHDFIHNAGHELKTPISVIHSNLQLLGQEKKLNKALVQEGIGEIDRLNKLIESLIELSSIQHVYTGDKISLKDEIEAIIKEFKGESAKKNVHISFVSQYEKSIYMNKQYFYMLFSNLLGNAIKYTDKDGHIDITLQKSKLIIKDDGIGIPKEDFKKIFNRFYQSSKGRDGSGFGIGLSLVKKIIDIHKMEIHLESDIGKGSIFTIEF